VIAYDGKWWLFTVGKNAKQEKSVEWLGLGVRPYPKLDASGIPTITSSSVK
jgi:hypothetical protein